MLKLKEAISLCDKVIAYGEHRQYNPLTAVVLDRGGHILCTLRHEDCGILRFDIAYGKAWGALGMGFGTRGFANMVQSSEKMQSFVHSLSVMSGGRVVPTQGGVLIRNSNGDLLGAIGVSGDSSERDEECILHAVRSMGMIAQP
ncbi:GlcG/HbpS family heme-binding protein [Reichenbachiella versicolor]|uniref:GlcG/HbpS family heme-binding protein n=1 Tax=Reichenbachiella versicolor TaxID=1821036 RepID=UPI000D6DD35E|nr:heme-binding protein [Reichenbachiella versicolor]